MIINYYFSSSVQVVDKNWQWNGGLVAVNSFGFGGANVHILLRSNPKPKMNPIKDNVPRLIGVSGRTEEAVKVFLEKVTPTTYTLKHFKVLFQFMTKYNAFSCD